MKPKRKTLDAQIADRFCEIGFPTKQELSFGDKYAIGLWRHHGGQLVYNSKTRKFTVRLNVNPYL